MGLWEENNLYDPHDIVRVLLKGNNRNDPYEAALMEADEEAIQKEQKIEDEGKYCWNICLLNKEAMQKEQKTEDEGKYCWNICLLNKEATQKKEEFYYII